MSTLFGPILTRPVAIAVATAALTSHRPDEATCDHETGHLEHKIATASK